MTNAVKETRKVAIIYFSSIYEKTGAGKVVKSFVDEIDSFKVHGVGPISIYTPYGANDSEKSSTKKEETIKTKAKKVIKKVIGRFYVGNCMNIEHTIFSNGRKAVEDYFIRSQQDEDIILFHDIGSCFEYIQACRKKNIKEKPYILVEHTNGYPWKMTEIYYPKIVGTGYRNKLEERSDECEQKAKYLVYVSEGSKQNAIERKPEMAEKIVSIPNGIVSIGDEYKKRSFEIIRLITVGTVCSRKNQIALIECVKRLRDYGVELTVVGAGNTLNDCVERAKELNVEDKVHFLGEQDDIPGLLNSANVFIMASFDEGLPIAAIEALRSGMPLILTDVGGCKELIEDNGYLVRPDVSELCEAILKIQGNESMANEMCKKSFKLYREKYSIESMVHKYSDIIMQE